MTLKKVLDSQWYQAWQNITKENEEKDEKQMEVQNNSG